MRNTNKEREGREPCPSSLGMPPAPTRVAVEPYDPSPAQADSSLTVNFFNGEEGRKGWTGLMRDHTVCLLLGWGLRAGLTVTDIWRGVSCASTSVRHTWKNGSVRVRDGMSS